MRNRLPIYAVYLLCFAYAWLHLILWKIPVLSYAGLITGQTYNPSSPPEWAITVNQISGAILTVVAVALMLRLKLLQYLLSFLFVFTIWIAGADFIHHHGIPNELIEHGIRFAVPLLLLLILIKRTNHLLLLSKIGIAATFIGHGLYAMGIPSIPDNFIYLTTNITGLTDQDASVFLFIVGLLDIICGIGLFIKPATKSALWYCIIWGLLTAFARIVGNWHLPADEIFFRWIPEMLLRLPNGLLPAWVLWTFYDQKTGTASTKV